MSHKSEHISTENGFSVKNGRTTTQVIDQDGLSTPVTDTIAAGVGGAISITSELTKLATDVGGDAYTLEDGFEGQLKTITLATDGGGDAVITPDNFKDGATITQADANDVVVLLFINATWVLTVNSGSVIA